MGQLKPLIIGMAGAGVLGVVIAVVVPLLVLTQRDRGAGEPDPFPSPTPVMEGIRQGQNGFSTNMDYDVYKSPHGVCSAAGAVIG